MSSNFVSSAPNTFTVSQLSFKTCRFWLLLFSLCRRTCSMRTGTSCRLLNGQSWPTWSTAVWTMSPHTGPPSEQLSEISTVSSHQVGGKNEYKHATGQDDLFRHTDLLIVWRYNVRHKHASFRVLSRFCMKCTLLCCRLWAAGGEWYGAKQDKRLRLPVDRRQPGARPVRGEAPHLSQAAGQSETRTNALC